MATGSSSHPSGRAKTPCHLVVMQHGLWGNPHNLSVVDAQLLAFVDALGAKQQQQQWPQSQPEQQQQQEGQDRHAPAAASSCVVRTLNSAVNTKDLTYDGVDTCGERLVALIKETAEKLDKEQQLLVTQISFIGYSLGGLISRYAVGKLEMEGAFTSGLPGTLGPWKPVNFVTIATPHLGAWRVPPPSLFRQYYNDFYHAMVPVISSTTGRQLMLKDLHAGERPILINLADPALPFYRGVARFRKLLLLGNTHGDQMVPYPTATISTTNPYENPGVDAVPALDPELYPSIVRPGSTPRPSTIPWFVLLAAAVLGLVLLPLLLLVFLAMISRGLWHAWSHTQTPDYSHWLTETSTGANGLDGTVKTNGAGRVESAAPPNQEQDASGEAASDVRVMADIVLEEKQGLVPASSAAPKTAAPMAIKQAWMVDSLNKLPWHKVDVDTRHPHAHAAIIMRPKASSQLFPTMRWKRSDQLRYTFEQMHWH